MSELLDEHRKKKEWISNKLWTDTKRERGQNPWGWTFKQNIDRRKGNVDELLNGHRQKEKRVAVSYLLRYVTTVRIQLV
jgi:hypothetical protein